MKTVRLGLTGIRGYAHHLTNLLLDAHKAGSPLQLVAITAPELADFSQRVTDLRGRGIEFVDDYEAMLARRDLDAVWLPLPIDMHLPFAERALQAGKAVMVEKPIAATIQECDRLIVSRDAAGLPVAVGFTAMYDPLTLRIKRLLLSGELGAVRLVTVLGCWPRGSEYYQRSPWVGRVRLNGNWILDSPANNAMSHYLNMTFFLLGMSEDCSALPTHVDAELYRVHPIENYDTCSLRFDTDRADAAKLLLLLTHACGERPPTVVTIECERGRVIWSKEDGVAIEVVGKPTVNLSNADSVESVSRRFAKFVRGVPDANCAVSTLETARVQTLAINGVSEAAPVHDVASDRFELKTLDNGSTLRIIPGIIDAFAEALRRGQMLHESGLVDWSVPADGMDLRGYDHFRGARGFTAEVTG